ncbi:cell division transport system permease protein [Catenuloplanes nepalensis]|uniref:Cell division transport system permease protein n=1 Tax=Catenuloplanes nepalensis TaxID=587533 RepID=A0ABT9MQF3_9ACTN|nr:permease-like cell division protein FtsX [Catenuloplanes nepalensis]MDP9793661.1 cell division transport system permease protein [Catenuloplanes nepalensis]
MRTLSIVAAALAAVLLLSACSSSAGGGGAVLRENPEMIVFLEPDITAGQRAEVEAALRALPGVSEVSLITKEQAYQDMTEFLENQPSAAPINKDNLSEKFTVRTTDLEAYAALRDGDTSATLAGKAGVDEVLFQCVTEAECRQELGS